MLQIMPWSKPNIIPIFLLNFIFSCFLKQQHDSAHAKCEGVGMQKLKAQIKKPNSQLRYNHECLIYCTPCIL
jgi:hypothetical protein